MVEGKRRLGTLVVVQRFASEPIAAAARREVVERLLQAVASQEPFERSRRPESVLGRVGDGESAQLRLDECRGVDGLLVAGARRTLASAASAVTRKPERVSVEPAFIA